MPEEETTQALRRLPDGKIDAPQGYVEYGGQVIVKTRYATVQRWKNSGWDSRRGEALPYILGADYCGRTDLVDVRNDHLEENEVEVYYVDGSERVVYEVQD